MLRGGSRYQRRAIKTIRRECNFYPGELDPQYYTYTFVSAIRIRASVVIPLVRKASIVDWCSEKLINATALRTVPRNCSGTWRRDRIGRYPKGSRVKPHCSAGVRFHPWLESISKLWETLDFPSKIGLL